MTVEHQDAAPANYPPAQVYERLERADIAEKTAIVLELIEQHPQHRLELPEHDGLRADLCGLDLSPRALRAQHAERLAGPCPPWWDGEFNCVNLQRANLRGALLLSAKLPSANLHYANLHEARLWLADLSGAHLLGADLRGAGLGGTDLRRANLVGADLRGANLRYTDLRGALLGHAKLCGANIWKADFSTSRLRGADLRWLDMSGAVLNGTHLSGANLANTVLHREQLGAALGEEMDGDLASAIVAYQALEACFSGQGDEQGARWAHTGAARCRRSQDWRQHRYGRYAQGLAQELGHSLALSLATVASPLAPMVVAASHGLVRPAQPRTAAGSGLAPANTTEELPRLRVLH